MMGDGYGYRSCSFFFQDGQDEMGELFCLSFFVVGVYLLFCSFFQLVSCYYQQNGIDDGYVCDFFLIDGSFCRDGCYFFVCIIVR